MSLGPWFLWVEKTQFSFMLWVICKFKQVENKLISMVMIICIGYYNILTFFYDKSKCTNSYKTLWI
jgi:hypothetical protein